MTATEQPALDRLAVLTSGGEHRGSWGTGTRGEQSAKLGDQLRAFRPAGGKETIRAALAVKEGETKFNLRNSRDFIDRFGSGTKDETKMTPAERASYRRAQELVRRNATIALFLEARSLPAGSRDTYIKDAMLKDAAGLGRTTDFATIRQTALESIVDNPSFVALFPEVNQSGMNKSQKLDFIEHTLMPAEDGRFASRLGTRLQETYKEAVGLSPVAGQEERTTLERTTTEETLKLEQRVKGIQQFLKGRNINNPATGAPYTEAQVADIIKNKALTVDNAVDALAYSLLSVPPPAVSNADFTRMKRAQIELPQSIDGLRAQLEAARIAMTPPPADLAAYIAARPTDPNVIAYNTQNGELTHLNTLYPARDFRVTAFKARVLPLYQDQAVVTGISEAKQSDLKLKDVNVKLLAMPTGDVEQARDKRMLQEEDLIGKLEGVLGESIADVLEERYDVMEERMGRLTTENQKKAEIETQKLVLELKKKMNKNWIGFDAKTHKKTTNKDQIKEDVTHLGFTYDKDMALKQLIARDLFGVKRYDTLNVVDGKNSRGTVLLTPDQIAQVNKVFELAGGEYRDKLFADLLAARSFGDRTWNFGFGMEAVSGKLGFKRGEWEQMLKLYEPEITKGIEGNREAAAALRTMEAQGVTVQRNMKWLIYVLAGLFGAGTGGIGGAIGGIGFGAGAAVGAAAEVGATKLVSNATNGFSQQ